MIKYAYVIGESVVDGKGVRAVAFLQGCTIGCEGCHNPLLQPLEGGYEVSEEELVNLLLKQISPVHKGITITGGEPILQAEALFKVISMIKKRNPKLDIWLYSGFTFEKIKDLPFMELVDILVDGPFVLAERDLFLPFRGSRNQRVIDVQQSLALGRVVLAE